MIMMGSKRHTLDQILGPRPGEAKEEEKEGAPDELHSISDELIGAVHSKDPKAVADALRAAFELCDSEPHVEGPHEDEE